jgi:hypothetical protein
MVSRQIFDGKGWLGLHLAGTKTLPLKYLKIPEMNTDHAMLSLEGKCFFSSSPYFKSHVFFKLSTLLLLQFLHLYLHLPAIN